LGSAAARSAERLHRVAERLAEVLAHAGMALISLFMVLQIVEIVGRKTIGFSILGLSEMGQLLVMSCICLALPFVFIRDGHIAVEFLTDALRPRRLALLKACVALTSTVFVAALAYFGFGQAAGQILKGDGSPTLHIPIVWYWAPLLLAIAASAASCAIQTFRYLAIALAGASPPLDGGAAPTRST
jgi:TRAP-type C4-dicarboxylate transport system permease small subunit